MKTEGEIPSIYFKTKKQQKMSKVKIGIPGWSTGPQSYGVSKTYLEYISTFGIPVILTPEIEVGDVEIDMLFLSGGPDLNPGLYGQKPSYFNGTGDLFRQWFYISRLQQYIESGIPIMGICLGMQMLAAHFGSRITQHLGNHPDSKNRWEKGHQVYVPVYTYGEELVYPQNFGMDVNSHHHQGVMLNDLSTDLLATQIFIHNRQNREIPQSEAVVEAFIHNNLPIFGVQWHPEEFYDEYTTSMVELFIDNIQNENGNFNKANASPREPFQRIVQEAQLV
jgi:putative glutamine amidotransferase